MHTFLLIKDCIRINVTLDIPRSMRVLKMKEPPQGVFGIHLSHLSWSSILILGNIFLI